MTRGVFGGCYTGGRRHERAGSRPVTTTQAKRWTVADLECLPQPWDDTRYEIVDGELFVASPPSNEHQYTCTEVGFELRSWSKRGRGGVVLGAPGLIFAEDDNAAPDVIWVSDERY